MVRSFPMMTDPGCGRCTATPGVQRGSGELVQRSDQSEREAETVISDGD